MILSNVPVARGSPQHLYLVKKNDQNFAQASRRVSVFGGHVHQRGSRHVRQNNAPHFDCLSNQSSFNICWQMALFEMVHTVILRFANMEKLINSLNLSMPIFRTLQYHIFTTVYLKLQRLPLQSVFEPH